MDQLIQRIIIRNQRRPDYIVEFRIDLLRIGNIPKGPSMLPKHFFLGLETLKGAYFSEKLIYKFHIFLNHARH